jgi:hypothetical protein
MRPWVSATLFLVAFTSTAAFAAIHRTKAQQAYFVEHEKCLRELREAKKAARAKPPEQRKAMLAAAKSEYDRCEAWAHLVWKYYPQRPPANAAQGGQSNGSGATGGPPQATPHPPR